MNESTLWQLPATAYRTAQFTAVDTHRDNTGTTVASRTANQTGCS